MSGTEGGFVAILMHSQPSSTRGWGVGVATLHHCPLDTSSGTHWYPSLKLVQEGGVLVVGMILLVPGPDTSTASHTLYVLCVSACGGGFHWVGGH